MKQGQEVQVPMDCERDVSSLEKSQCQDPAKAEADLWEQKLGKGVRLVERIMT